jgi:hypothetical protein
MSDKVKGEFLNIDNLGNVGDRIDFKFDSEDTLKK